MQSQRPRGRSSAGRISAETLPSHLADNGTNDNQGESSGSRNNLDQATEAQQSASRIINDATASQVRQESPEPPVYNEPLESSTGGSPNSHSSSLPGYTSDERPPYPHDIQANNDRARMTSWLTSSIRSEMIEIEMTYVIPDDDFEVNRRAVEVAVDNHHENALNEARYENQLTYSAYRSWPAWNASVRRHNQFHRNLEEHSGETLEEIHDRTDGPFELAFGPEPLGLRPESPFSDAPTEFWDNWLESESRWGSIWLQIIEGETPQRAQDIVDEDMEDSEGRRLYYFRGNHVHMRAAVFRPEVGSEDHMRHQSFRDAFAAAGASPDRIEEIFHGFYVIDWQTCGFYAQNEE